MCAGTKDGPGNLLKINLCFFTRQTGDKGDLNMRGPGQRTYVLLCCPGCPASGGAGGVEGGAHRTVIEKVHGYRGDNRLGSRGAKRASVT